MDKIAIHSVPRSGSTWLGCILNSHSKICYKYQPLFSYAFKDYLTTNSSNEEIEKFFSEITKSKDDFINQNTEIAKGIIPRFKKEECPSHICYKEVRYHNVLENMFAKTNDIRGIFLVRNPLAVIYSWSNAPKEFRTDLGWNLEEEWMYAQSKNNGLPEEFNGYFKWKEAAKIFFKLKALYAERVMIVNYSELLYNSMFTVRSIFNFINLDIDSQTTQFLDKSKAKHNDDPYSVFKITTEDNKWQDLPKEIIEYVQNDLKNTSLEYLLYE